MAQPTTALEKKTNPPYSKHIMEIKNFYQTYKDICFNGYSILGRTNKTERIASNHWQYEKGLPPSYSAHGRYRFLKTLVTEKSVQAKRVLEVAAGGGFNAICVREEGTDVVINDLLPLPESFQDFKGADKIEFVHKNLFDLSVEQNGQFDLIVCCEVIEHIAHGNEFISKIKSLLTPDGKVILTTPNGKYFRSKLPTFSQVTDFSALEEMQFKPDADGHLYLYTCDELRDLLEGVGFKNLEFDLSITPFISGHLFLRYLPKMKFLFPLFYFLDKCLKSLNREYFCNQIIVTARL